MHNFYETKTDESQLFIPFTDNVLNPDWLALSFIDTVLNNRHVSDMWSFP